MKRQLLFLCLLIVAFSCNTEVPDREEIQQQLMEKLTREEALLDFIQAHPEVFIAKNDHCNTNNCVDYFLNAGITIPIYSKEDAFMRNLKKQIIIQDINLDAETPYLEYQLFTDYKDASTRKILLSSE